MRKHLRLMANLVNDLKIDGHVLIDKRLQAIIHSLPESWEHMKVQMTHNKSIVTFNEIVRHLEVKEE